LYIEQAERIQVIHPYQGVILEKQVSTLEELNISFWVPAMYWVRATNLEGKSRVFKVVKQ
jgi:hypothetical protein